jgi:hypothetical protein
MIDNTPLDPLNSNIMVDINRLSILSIQALEEDLPRPDHPRPATLG